MAAGTYLGLDLHRKSILAGRTGVRRFTNELGSSGAVTTRVFWNGRPEGTRQSKPRERYRVGSSKRRYTGLRRLRHAAECGFVWSPDDDLAPAPAQA